MGFKRTFDSEDVHELNVKQARQISYSNKLAKLDEGVPYPVSMDKSGLIGEDQSDDLCGFKCEDNVETGAPFSWAKAGFEEDAQSGGTSQSTLSHESPESESPWRLVLPADNVYWCQSSPRKPVPVGSDYQADIPECVKDQAWNQLGGGDDTDLDEEKLMGKIVIPMPDYETEDCEVGKGRKECVCADKGSIRCVQQHVMENREALFQSLGYEKCLDLGLCEMGEEVAGKLTEDEEDLFHEIVYSNPVSLDRDFWKHLKSAFPSRTMKEIVSYYFNVFILRRRAVQNRSKSLDVDSDDDEWQIEYDGNFSAVETPDKETGMGLSRDDEEGEGEEEVTAEEDDPYISYQLQPHCPVRNRAETDLGDHWRHCNDLVDPLYSFDPCWTKNFDLLPTSNIMDELFGQDPWDDFPRGK